MDDIQSYTDKLRKTYRQSLDVVLPFTNHEVVVHCNDDEFDTYLEENHSVKDLQACIYLLERHIDLQQEIIQGLTHLQEIHKFDETPPAEYNVTADKLLAAQNKLAVLRSRTIRCLTKQIQQRCGDASLHLPRWTSGTDKQIINDLHDSLANNVEPYPSEANTPAVTPQSHNSSSETTSIIKSDNLANSIYQNVDGFEKTLEKRSDFDKNDEVFEENNTRNDDILQTRTRNLHKNDKLVLQSGALGTCSQFLGEKQPSQGDKTTTAFYSDHLEEKVVSESPEENKKTNIIVETHSKGTQEQDNPTIENGDSERQLASSSKGVQLFLNVSNLNSGKIEEEAVSRVTSRHIVEPVEERVTVEVLQSKSRDGVSEKASEQAVCDTPKIIDEDLNTNKIEASSDRSHSILNSESEPETSLKNNPKTMNWDPSLLIKKILGKVKPINTEQLESADLEEIHMAGYLEKLPVNQKKATLLKSWRKRYFKILHGKLFYFEDHRATAPISFIKLGGCLVVEMGNKCLQVTENEDLGGKSLMIRCGTWPELQDWRKALENQAKVKVKRQHFELVQEKKLVIIIDFGSSSIKAGFLEDQAWPQVIIPSVYAVNKDDSKLRFYGYEALRPYARSVSKLVYPLRSPLTVGKYLLDPNDLIGFLEIIFKELQVDPSHYQVVMTTPVNLRGQDKERLVEILFDYFQVAAVYMTCQAILSLYSYSATCGIVVNIGDHIDVVPVEEGYIVASGVKTLPYGGRLITDRFSRLLSSSGYRYFSEVENYIAEYLKVKTCYVSKDFSKETETFSESDYLTVDMSEFDLPSGDKLVTVAKERCTAFEGLFKPELWGKDTPGLPDLVYDAVMACSIDSRKEMCRNIFLSGATTKIPGLAERLQTELSRKFPSSLVIQVHAAPDRQFAAFIGAAVLASLETFADLCISRDDWEKTGPELLQKWDGV